MMNQVAFQTEIGKICSKQSPCSTRRLSRSAHTPSVALSHGQVKVMHVDVDGGFLGDNGRVLVVASLSQFDPFGHQCSLRAVAGKEHHNSEQ